MWGKKKTNHKLEIEKGSKTFFSGMERGEHLPTQVLIVAENHKCERWQGKVVWWNGPVPFIVGLGPGFNLYKIFFHKTALLR